MQTNLHRLADEMFGHVRDRKQRVHLAENQLVRNFFSDNAHQECFVEVGANDPHVASQTWHLEEGGWSGVLIEPIPQLCSQLRAKRANSVVVEAACGSPEQIGTARFYVKESLSQSTLDPDRLKASGDVRNVIDVRIETLNQIMINNSVSHIDFLSIDVEGFQREVIEGTDLRQFNVRLLLVEDHLYDWQTHRAIAAQGYRLVKRTVRNNWYVPVEDRFGLTTAWEQLQLWKKLFLGTPFRRFRKRRFLSRSAKAAS